MEDGCNSLFKYQSGFTILNTICVISSKHMWVLLFEQLLSELLLFAFHLTFICPSTALVSTALFPSYSSSDLYTVST
jgi:hypothetical protein